MLETQEVSEAPAPTGEPSVVRSWIVPGLLALVAVIAYTWIAGAFYVNAQWPANPDVEPHHPHTALALVTVVFAVVAGLGTLKKWEFGAVAAVLLFLVSLFALIQQQTWADNLFFSLIQVGALVASTWATIPLLAIISWQSRLSRQSQSPLGWAHER